MSKKVNRNDPCPCGSGKKYKQCCLSKEAQVSRHTQDGKFKFTAEVFNANHQAKYQDLAKKFATSLPQTSQKSTFDLNITKNKTVGKKTVRKAQAKTDRELSENLKQHSFETAVFSKEELDNYNQEKNRQKELLDENKFEQTEKDFRSNSNENLEK